MWSDTENIPLSSTKLYKVFALLLVQIEQKLWVRQLGGFSLLLLEKLVLQIEQVNRGVVIEFKQDWHFEKWFSLANGCLQLKHNFCVRVQSSSSIGIGREHSRQNFMSIFIFI